MQFMKFLDMTLTSAKSWLSVPDGGKLHMQ
jgi:hypothetical protein